MPSIAIKAARYTVTAATTKGVVTVASTTDIFPGTNAWLAKDDGSAAVRVRVLQILSATTFLVRKWPVKQEPDGSASYTQENFGPPNYGLSDVSAFNLTSKISFEAQTAPIDPAYTKRALP